jgi:alkylation response protein AidB-like acyl-CoA dehydrogenase
MDASTRTVAITAGMPEAVASWTARYGRAPSRRELLRIRQAETMATRHGKEGGVIDWGAMAARWDARLGGQLASIAPRVAARCALQVHGAIGYTRECDVSLWLAKVQALSATWGSQAEHRAVVLAALSEPETGPWT